MTLFTDLIFPHKKAILAALLVGLFAGLISSAVAGAETDGTKRPYILRLQVASDGVMVQEVPTLPATPPVPTPTQGALVLGFWGEVTHYGEGFNGQQMGCPGSGKYWGTDTTIAAVGPGRYADWPCGTQFRVTGPAGSIWVTRQDSCPGCGDAHLDLSEAGMWAVCGYLGRCPVRIEVLQ